MVLSASDELIAFLKENCWVNAVPIKDDEINVLFFPYWMYVNDSDNTIEIIKNPKEHPLLKEDYTDYPETILWLIGAIGDTEHHVFRDIDSYNKLLNKKFSIKYSKQYLDMLERVKHRLDRCKWHKPWTWIFSYNQVL